jgi:hypothetical protein
MNLKSTIPRERLIEFTNIKDINGDLIVSVQRIETIYIGSGGCISTLEINVNCHKITETRFFPYSYVGHPNEQDMMTIKNTLSAIMLDRLGLSPPRPAEDEASKEEVDLEKGLINMAANINKLIGKVSISNDN